MLVLAAKSPDDVRKLIAGPTVYICDDASSSARHQRRGVGAGEVQGAECPAEAGGDQSPSGPVRLVARSAPRRRLAVCRSTTTTERINARQSFDEVELAKSNIVLIGPPASRERRCSRKPSRRFWDVPSPSPTRPR